MDINALGESTLWLSSIIGPIMSLVILWIAFVGGLNKGHWLGRLAILVMTLGLFGQAIRSYIAITTGNAPTDAELPLWYLKDFGISLYGAYLFLKHYKIIKDEEA